MEDAVNLGWKLAATGRGWGGEKLLDSYDAERRPIFEQTAEVMIAGGIEPGEPVVECLAQDHVKACRIPASSAACRSGVVAVNSGLWARTAASADRAFQPPAVAAVIELTRRTGGRAHC